MKDELPHHANLRDGIQPPPREPWLLNTVLLLIGLTLCVAFAHFATKAVANAAATRIQAEDMLK